MKTSFSDRLAAAGLQTFAPLGNFHGIGSDKKLAKDVGTVLQRYLEFTIAETYQQQVPIPWTNSVVSTDFDLSLLAVGRDRMFAYQTSYRGSFGKTLENYNDSTDRPTIDVGRANRSFSALRADAAIYWDTAQLESERVMIQAGMLDQTSLAAKLLATRKIAEQDQHELALYGLAPEGVTGFQGLLNVDGAVTVNLTTDILLPSTTYDAIYTELVNQIITFENANRRSASEATLVMPTEAKIALNRDNDLAVTLSEKLTDPNRPIRVGSIVYVDELSAANLEEKGILAPATDKSRAVLAFMDAGSVRRKIHPLNFLAPFTQNDFLYKQICYYGQTELIIPDTTVITYLDFNKAA